MHGVIKVVSDINKNIFIYNTYKLRNLVSICWIFSIESLFYNFIFLEVI